MYQKVIIAGNLGRDPEMRFLPDGTPVTNFSVAVNERWKDREGEPQERTLWFRVTAWRGLAETCNQYLSKGRQVLVEGRMNADDETGGPRVYTRNDGTAGASFEITAAVVKFLGSRSDALAEDGDAPEVEDESVPF